MKKIKNQKSKIKNHRFSDFDRGYTLIELLAVMAVLIVVGAIVGQILFSALRGTNKTNTISDVNQSGDYAISQMSKMIRNAQFFNGVTGETPPTPVFNTDCTTMIPDATSITMTSFDGGTTKFSCDLSSSPPTISSNGASLLDTSSVEIDKSASTPPCQFTCYQDSVSGSTRIGIEFTLEQNLNVTPTPGITLTPAEEKSHSAFFQTYIILRNSSR